MIAGDDALSDVNAIDEQRDIARILKKQGEFPMRIAHAAIILPAILAVASPVFAAGNMMSSPTMMSSGAMMASSHGTMMQKGEAMIVTPNGETMSVMAQGGAGQMAMMKHARPLDQCLVLMMGKDGKMYMTDDMKMSNGKMLCQDMMAMKH